jgi:hypothetical protein
MSGRLVTLVLVIAAFGALSILALMDVGFLGIVESHFKNWAGGQVLADLVILAVLGCIWMVKDGRERGLAAWPFVLITPFVGSFGLLFYLVMRELRANAPSRA